MKLPIKLIALLCLTILIIPMVGCIPPDVTKLSTLPSLTPEYLEGSQAEEPTLPTKDATAPPLRWYALGDSITQGFYSCLNKEGSAALRLDVENGWPALMAKNSGWELTNCGIGGTGYVSKNPSTGNNKKNAREQIASLSSDDHFKNCDLVTLAYGVNDWKYNLPLGTMEDDLSVGGTLYSNMRWIIENIQCLAPEAQIIVISPINCSRYGSANTGWGMSYSFDRNGTLEDICRAEQEICEYYGIPFIDMLHDSTTVTAKNVSDVLPDGVHPTMECHKALAVELEKKIAAQLLVV